MYPVLVEIDGLGSDHLICDVRWCRPGRRVRIVRDVRLIHTSKDSLVDTCRSIQRPLFYEIEDLQLMSMTRFLSFSSLVFCSQRYGPFVCLRFVAVKWRPAGSHEVEALTRH